MEFWILMTSSYYEDKIDVSYHKSYEDAILSLQKSFYQPRSRFGDQSYWTNVKWIRWVDLDRGYHSDTEVEVTFYSID